ncbi:MAG: hypothetical protein NTW83_04495 [Cyanobacteria bacterium]|nr:hypothetical protein [Cyanobacteriota bacterium]
MFNPEAVINLGRKVISARFIRKASNFQLASVFGLDFECGSMTGRQIGSLS